jgi:uncharacterized protein (TIGR03083 family)
MSDTALTPERYLDLLRSDSDRLVAMGERGLDAAVPSCPGWTVADLLRHTAEVYEHKIKVMQLCDWPDPWPPDDFETREPVGFLKSATDRLFEEFAQHSPNDKTITFFPGADTVIFWIRRMAQEAVVHRYDGELAHDETTPAANDLAVDGVDEVLRVFLGDPDWADYDVIKRAVEAVILLRTDGHEWCADVRDKVATIASTGDGMANPAATIQADPGNLLMWLWGRAPLDVLTIDGDRDVVTEFRARLVEVTQ